MPKELAHELADGDDAFAHGVQRIAEVRIRREPRFTHLRLWRSFLGGKKKVKRPPTAVWSDLKYFRFLLLASAFSDLLFARSKRPIKVH